MKAELLTIGDELLIGQVINTNAAWLGERLSATGIELVRTVTLGDEMGSIHEALTDACRRADLLIVTGGLGPTQDDLTRDALAAAFDAPLRLNDAVFEGIKARFARGSVAMPERNRLQAMVPEGFEVIENAVGTAPGMWFEGDECLVVVMPGVPFEMKKMMDEVVLPRLRQRKDLRVIRQRTLLTSGIGESNLEAHLGDLSGFLGPDVHLASLPSADGVRLRITALADDAAEADARLTNFETYLRDQLGRYLYGIGEDTLEAVVGQLLSARGQTIATAESCTGGLIGHRLTNVAGSSAYMLGGVVAYCNSVKTKFLGVDVEVLDSDGAVSEGVALMMARTVREKLGSDIGVATTGIMGPTGGSPGKPVGMVWIGYADAEKDLAVVHRFGNTRLVNKERAAAAALNLVRLHLM